MKSPQDLDSKKSIKISFWSSFLTLIFIGFQPLWSLIGSKNDGGLGALIASLMLTPIVVVICFMLSFLLHKLFFKLKFNLLYSIIFSLLVGFITFMSVGPASYFLATFQKSLINQKIKPNVRVENQVFNNNVFSYDIVINNNSNKEYSLNQSVSNFGPSNDSEIKGIISINDDPIIFPLNNFLLKTGENRFPITNRLILDKKHYRYKNFANRINEPFKIMIALYIRENDKTKTQIFYETYFFDVDPKIQMAIENLYK